MDKSKILTIVTAVLGVIGIFLLIRVLMADEGASLDGSVGAFVSYAYYLLILTAVITVGLSILNLIKHPKALMKALLGIGVMVALFLIAYFGSSGNAVTDGFGNVLKGGEAGFVSHIVSALINFTGILGVVGIVIIALGVVKSLK
jgi:hypothetical protein